MENKCKERKCSKLCAKLYIQPFIPIKGKLNINQASTFLNNYLYICLNNNFTNSQSRFFPANTKIVDQSIVPNKNYLQFSYTNYVFRLPGILTISNITTTNISFEIHYILAAYTDRTNYKIYFDPRYINVQNETPTPITINGSQINYIEFPYDESTGTYDTTKTFDMMLNSNSHTKNETGIVSYRVRGIEGYDPTPTQNTFSLSYVQSKNKRFPSYPNALTGSTITNDTLMYNGSLYRIVTNKSTIMQPLTVDTWENFIGKPYAIHKFNIRL